MSRSKLSFSHFAIVLCSVMLVLTTAGCNVEDSTQGNSRSSKERRIHHDASVSALRTQAIASTMERLESEVESHGGWIAWRRSLHDFQADVRTFLAQAKSNGDRAIYTHEGFIFNISELMFIANETAELDEHGRYPISNSRAYDVVLDLSRQLKAREIDLLVVPVPVRAEVYPEALSTRAREGMGVNMLRAAFILELLKADVEVIDLLPIFKKAKHEPSISLEQSLYHKEDMHYSTDGIKVVARAIADRLQRYDFNINATDRKADYTTNSFIEPALASYEEYIAHKKPPHDRPWKIEQLIDDSEKPFKPNDESPLLIIGDSFVGHPLWWVPGTNITAHISKELRMNVSQVWRPQDGPQIVLSLARRGKRFIDSRRVVVAIFTSRVLRSKDDKLWKRVTLP